MKKTIVFLLVLTVLGLGVVVWAFRTPPVVFDTVALHYHVVASAEIEDPRERTLLHTEFLTQAFGAADEVRQARDGQLQRTLFLFLLIFMVSGLFLYLYYEVQVIRPFRKLQHFAAQITAGNLDMPLEADRHNLFGAFTESFDIMRVELKTAREMEMAANKSKKELVASLAHDIGTPIASIQSAIELMRLNAQEADMEKLDAISVKLVQIDTLMSNMLQATLEELQALHVSPVDFQSTEIKDLINQADYEHHTQPFTIPPCLVQTDPARLQQVFDNIFKNTYKYGRPPIRVNAFIDEDNLFVEVQDNGPGVPENELDLLTGKFYRGKNAEKSGGYGLGLYLARFFMEKMGGGVYLENREGFVVVLVFKLS